MTERLILTKMKKEIGLFYKIAVENTHNETNILQSLNPETKMYDYQKSLCVKLSNSCIYYKKILENIDNILTDCY